MDFIDLFARPALAGSPVSLIVRPDFGELKGAAELGAALLAESGFFGEVLLGSTTFPALAPAAKIAGIRVRVIVTHEAERWTAVLAEARHPRIVVVSVTNLPSAEELRQLVGQLEHADVVVGRRRWVGLWSWLGWPMDRLTRSFWGVPFADPFCPTRGVRRSAVEGMVIQSGAPIEDFEILAKTTYLVRLVDEIPLMATAARAGIVGTLLSSWREMLGLLWSPMFGECKSFVELTRGDARTGNSQCHPEGNSQCHPEEDRLVPSAPRTRPSERGQRVPRSLMFRRANGWR